LIKAKKCLNLIIDLKEVINLKKGNCLADEDIASKLPEGLKEIAAIPAKQDNSNQNNPAVENVKADVNKSAENKSEKNKPAHSQIKKMEKTQKEKELEEALKKRKELVDQLKVKNKQVAELKKEISLIFPKLKKAGSNKVLRLMKQEEEIEFLISTEAHTPKQEKELLQKLKEIKAEISKYKEAENLKNLLDKKKRALKEVISEIKSLESELSKVRKECNLKYSEVVAERKAAFEEKRRKKIEKQLEKAKGFITLEDVAIIKKKK
jgi:uncharacterized coiled-coil DUF342 family protein